MTPYETLRAALESRLKTETLYRVAKESDCKWDTIRKFSEGGGLQPKQFDALCTYLGLELTPVKKKR